MKILENVSLKSFNTFGIDAKARFFVETTQPHEFEAILSDNRVQYLPKVILGEGSNVLFTQNFAGLVIRNAIKGIQTLDETQDFIWLQAHAGENWHDFVIHCVNQNYGGIENLSLIPGTVGAAPIQNIGAYGVELKDTFMQLEALNLKNGNRTIFNYQDCQFGYRDSIFKNQFKNQYAILSLVLKLNKKPALHLEYGNIKDMLTNMQVKEPTIKTVSDAVMQIRRSKLPDPKQLGNAGSFFKNPIISTLEFEYLKQSYPKIPSFHAGDNEIKIPAGWLIEQCGWKGKRIGNIGVYEKQALILINYGQGTGPEIKALAEQIQKSVQEQFGILLSPEVNFI